MNGTKPLIALALLAVFLIAADASENNNNNNSTKVDKLPVAKKKLQQAKTAEATATKLRLPRDVASSGSGGSSKVLSIGKDKMLALTSGLSRRTSQGMDLMSAAGEKKYMLVKKKPKHKKIKMEVFKPKMKYKKIKMKIPVKKMKKKKVKGYLVKKEHGHHEY